MRCPETRRQHDRLLTFRSVHDAIRAETLLGRAGLGVESVPTPRDIDMSCGQSLTFAAADQPAVLAVLAGSAARWNKLYRRCSARVYEKLLGYEG